VKSPAVAGAASVGQARWLLADRCLIDGAGIELTDELVEALVTADSEERMEEVESGGGQAPASPER